MCTCLHGFIVSLAGDATSITFVPALLPFKFCTFSAFSISVFKKNRKKNIAVSINYNNSGVLECTFSNDP